MNAQKIFESSKISKGDFFTVTKWKSHFDNSYKGDCLEVVALSLPFIRARNHDGLAGLTCNVITLSLDAVDITPLDPEFVESVLQSVRERKARREEIIAKQNT